MKHFRKYSLLFCLLSALLFSSVFGNIALAVETEEEMTEVIEKPEAPAVDADGKPILPTGVTGILVERKTGYVLFEKDSRKRMYPASTTKVMTALLALEAVEQGVLTMETPFTVTEDILEGLDPDGTNIALKPGETLTLLQLLHGLMIASGNDAAVAIATLVSGSEIAFVDRMNQRAAELELTDTHFVNPHGLHDENHYTTAADMAEIARTAMGLASFRNIVDIAHIKIPPTNMTEEERYYINTNGLISAMRYRDYYYPKSTGIKTGYTSEAGNCLVASATDKGMELVSVLFGADGVDHSHKGSILMLDYGFSSHTTISPVGENQIMGEIKVRQARQRDSVTLSSLERVSVVAPNGTVPEDLEVKLHLPESLKAPIAKGEQVGTFSIYLEGQELGGGILCADTEVKRSFFWPALALFEWLWSFLLIRVLCYFVLIVFGLFVVVFLLRFYNEIRRSMRKREK